MERVFHGTVKDLPTETAPQEQPRTPKKARVMRPLVFSEASIRLWSTMEVIVPSTSSEPETPTTSIGSQNPTTSIRSQTPPPVPSPALGFHGTVRDMPTETAPQEHPRTPKKARKTRPSVSSEAISSSRPFFDTKMGILINYGSEEESDDDEEKGDSHVFMVPRTARAFLCEEEDQEEATPVQLPPSSPHHSRDAQTSSPASPAASKVASSLMPNNKFHFEWRSSSTTQISANLRRERFSEIKPGPTVSFTTPYEAFTAIWDREIIETIVSETNIYAQQQTAALLDAGAISPQSRITHWRDTNVDEIYTFFAIVLGMSIVVKSRVEEYWNKKKDLFSTPGFSQYMSYNRFSLLSKCLHFNNNFNFNGAMMTGSQAKLFKIQPIVDHLNRKFSQLYILNQNLALDESLTMWKGWLDINQFIRNKAATVGIKTYEICESNTGYLWRFEVHAGQKTLAPEKDDPLSRPIPALVLRLLDGLEGKGHTIWMDNFYNSPALARELKIRGFDCVGTLRTNRQFVPSELASLSKGDMTVGEVVACTSGDVDLTVWRDKNLVAFISTYHGSNIFRSAGIEKPAVANDYNLCMGGVDRKDQILSMFPVERKRTKVWYKKFFRRLLNVSVLNAYILLNKNTLTHRNFRKQLVDSLITAHGTQAEVPEPTKVTKQSIQHYPAHYDHIAGGQYRRKHVCTHCRKRTTTYCKVCNLAMCAFTCFDPYHNSQKKPSV